MARDGEKGFKVLREIISPENVQAMAELITIKQAQYDRFMEAYK